MAAEASAPASDSMRSEVASRSHLRKEAGAAAVSAHWPLGVGRMQGTCFWSVRPSK